MKEHIVIVGGGQAGAYAAKTIVSNHSNSKVSIISEEKYLPYERPPIT